MLIEWDPFANPILADQIGHREVWRHRRGDRRVQEQVDEFTGPLLEGDHRVEGPGAAPAHLDQGRKRRHGCARAAAGGREPRGGQPRARTSPRATSWPRCPARPRRPRTSPAVCRGWRSSSRPASPRTSPSSRRSTAPCPSGPDSRGKRRVIVTPDYEDAEPKEYLIPKGKHISVHEGDRVRAGEALMDGSSRTRTTSSRSRVRRSSRSTWWTRFRRSIASRACGSTTSTSRRSCARCCAGCA